jgi:intein/homing endonuclease
MINPIFIHGPEVAEFLGWYVGDGCLSVSHNHYEFTLTGDLTEELDFYNQIIVPRLSILFVNKISINLRKYPSVGVCGVYIFNKGFTQYLQNTFGLNMGKKTNIRIPKIIQSREQKISFVRGLFDTDGSIFFCRSNSKTKKITFAQKYHCKPKIKLTSISKVLIDEVNHLLISLGFSPRLYRPSKRRENEHTTHFLVLDTKANVEKWLNEIGFNSSKHNSKILVWQRFGYCPPFTTILQRRLILDRKLDPKTLYK